MGYRPSSRVCAAVPALTQMNYSAADKFAGGVLTFTDAQLNQGAGTLLTHVTVTDAAHLASPFNLLIFHDTITLTDYLDNAAATIPSADLAKLSGVVPIAATDYVTIGGSVSIARPSVLPMVCRNTTDKNIYGVIVTGAAVNWASASALRLKLGFTQD